MNWHKRPVVLVVDDNPTNIEILAEALGPDVDVIISTDGQTAIDVVCVEDVDVVLLDIMMPEMDGYEVCRRIKGQDFSRDVPIIFVTALADKADEEFGLKLGAVDYITKPVSPAIVRARVSNHVTLKRQQDFLKRLSSVDGLTGVSSRRYFDEVIDREWRRSLRNSDPMSVMLIDVDRFAKFNEKMGHAEGDGCLKSIGWCLAEEVKRPSDLLCRYDGNRFVVLLPETAADIARGYAEAIHTAVHSLGIPHPTSDVAQIVTVSIGVATTIAVASRDPRDLVSRADQMLYEAKRMGRNRVHVGGL